MDIYMILAKAWSAWLLRESGGNTHLAFAMKTTSTSGLPLSISPLSGSASAKLGSVT